MPCCACRPKRASRSTRSSSRTCRRRRVTRANKDGTSEAMQVPYAELHCLSNFSFLRGASHPEELVERALALEYDGLAITDECSFAGSVRAHLQLKDLRENDELARSFRLIHGTELQLIEGVGRGAT